MNANTIANVISKTIIFVIVYLYVAFVLVYKSFCFVFDVLVQVVRNVAHATNDVAKHANNYNA